MQETRLASPADAPDLDSPSASLSDALGSGTIARLDAIAAGWRDVSDAELDEELARADDPDGGGLA